MCVCDRPSRWVLLAWQTTCLTLRWVLQGLGHSCPVLRERSWRQDPPPFEGAILDPPNLVRCRSAPPPLFRKAKTKTFQNRVPSRNVCLSLLQSAAYAMQEASALCEKMYHSHMPWGKQGTEGSINDPAIGSEGRSVGGPALLGVKGHASSLDSTGFLFGQQNETWDLCQTSQVCPSQSSFWRTQLPCMEHVLQGSALTNG